jgi:type II secretory pathway component GspD/PulD (secretin)
MVLKLDYKPVPVLRFYCGFGKRCKVALISFFLLFCCAGILAAETTDVSKPTPDRYRVVQLKYISAQDGIRLLADANITTASQLNQDNTLLITAQPAVLVKAAAILGLVDSREKFAVKALLPASEANGMPNADAIQNEIGGISVGTFFNMPGGTGYRAIIDVHEDKLFAVAPVAVMDKIVAIAQQVKSEKSDQQGESVVSGTSSIEQQGPNDVEQAAQPDKLFNELLSSISEAEKGLPQTSTGQVEPRQETKEPSTEPNLEQPGSKGKTKVPAADANATQPESSRRSYEPLVVTNGDETLELTLPEKLDVINLLDLMGKYLNLNYVYDPKQVQGKEVYLKVQGPIKVRELYPLAESVMKFTGLVMTRKGNLVTIVPIESAMEIDPTLIDSSRGQVRAGDVIVTRIFQLNYIDNASARNLLEQMKLGAVTDAGPGTIIVTGYAYRMSRIEELLGIIDKPGKPKQIKFRKLTYTTAKTLAPKVKQLIEQMGDISIAISKAETTAQPVRGRIPIRQAPGAPPQPTPTSESVKPTVFLDADERTNRILMIGQEVELAVVNDLIDAMDVAQQDLRSLRVYEIQHVEAEDVRKKLEELGIVGANKAATPGRITARAAAPGQPGAPPVQSPVSASTSNPESELPTEEMQVVVIEATNSLLVNASPEQHVLVATIISYVDSESEQKTIPYKVYPLQNQPPGHIAEILTKLVQEVVRDKEGKIEKVVKNTEDNIIIVPDANTFSLIVYASKKNQDWIADLIKNLDKRRPQVLIDVTLVEVTRTDLFDLDLQLASKFPRMEPGGTMDFLPALIGGAGTGTGDSNSGSTGFLKNRSREAFSFPKGNKAQGFYSDEHIQALLTALESKSYGRVLAKPKILVNDGQTGVIKTTDTTNVRIDSSIIPNQGTAVTNTSFQAYSAGITLEIQPNIGDGDLLLLIVKLDRTDFGTRSAADVPPDTIATNVNTIVTVPNNKTIILGGLVKLNQGKGSTKVPLLGDLPLVGGLFRSTTDSVDDSKLYVFVKANILRPETTLAGMSEIEKISEKSRNAFEKSEDMFQNHQDWPGMKPSPVDPVRVLDAE